MRGFLVLLWVLCSFPVFAKGAGLDSKSEQYFIDPSVMIARRVSIDGRLYWKGEGREIYPTWTSVENPSSRYCLPVLIDDDNDAMIAKASALHGVNVRVEELIAYSARTPGMISVTACKQLGIYVVSMERIVSD